ELKAKSLKPIDKQRSLLTCHQWVMGNGFYPTEILCKMALLNQDIKSQVIILTTFFKS
ncbi:MAG: hypothetical protein RLZZ04_3528, partial [Cyanobacteriota bacterium]